MQTTEVNHRFERQIETLLNVFKEIHLQFQQNYPVDHALSQLFRKHTKFGSRARRFISGAIFGFYRWYGWLHQLEHKKQETALLMAYLLDGNEITPLIIQWVQKLELPADFLLKFECPGTLTIETKSEILSSFIPDANVEKLNPDWVDSVSRELTIAFQKRPNVWIRRKSLTDNRILEFLDLKNVSYRIHPYQAVTVEILGKVNLSESKIYHQGKVEVQDIASQGVGLICRPKAGEHWWDMCAGSGGKSLHLANLMKNKGKIFATEIRETIMGELQKRIRRGKWTSIEPILWDGKKPPVFQKALDGVLVDAPCSCSGTWRRSPDLRWQLKQEALSDFQKTQLHLLTIAATQLRSRGILVYATCSIFCEENEEVVEKFLDQNRGFSLDVISHPFIKKEPRAEFNFTPLDLDGNAMYIARMKKE